MPVRPSIVRLICHTFTLSGFKGGFCAYLAVPLLIRPPTSLPLSVKTLKLFCRAIVGQREPPIVIITATLHSSLKIHTTQKYEKHQLNKSLCTIFIFKSLKEDEEGKSRRREKTMKEGGAQHARIMYTCFCVQVTLCSECTIM